MSSFNYRKLLLTLCIALAIFAQQNDAITFDCSYTIDDWVLLNDVYGCTVKDLKIGDGDSTLESVSGAHIEGKGNDDVETLNIENSTFRTMPKEIDYFFPNLKGLRIVRAGLRSIGTDDLKPFPNLKVLCLWSNELSNLDGNLFINNPNIEFINFGSNQIQHVGPYFFSPLKNLIAGYFEENTCTNHTKQFDVESLKFEITVRCPPSFEMLDGALLNGGKLATKNDEIDNKLKLLEDRIAELEHSKK